jgi:hypothetical protein
MGGFTSIGQFWRGCFVFTVVIALAQTIGILAIFLTLLGAPYWPTVTLNAAFLAMGLDGLTSPHRRRLLLGPILWFGLYGAALALSHGLLARERSLMHRMQAHVSPSGSLLLIPGATDASLLSDLTPHQLLHSYDLNEVFSRRPGDLAGGRTRLAREACPRTGGWGKTPEGEQGRSISRGGYPSRRPWEVAASLCEYTGLAAPSGPVTTIAASNIVRHRGLVEGIVQDFTISRPGIAPVTVRSAQLSALSWWPVPVIGCHFKGGFGDRWDRGCHAYFDHPSWRGQADNTPLAVVARALGLRKATIEQRYPTMTWIDPGRR